MIGAEIPGSSADRSDRRRDIHCAMLSIVALNESQSTALVRYIRNENV